MPGQLHIGTHRVVAAYTRYRRGSSQTKLQLGKREVSKKSPNSHLFTTIGQHKKCLTIFIRKHSWRVSWEGWWVDL